MIVVGMGFFSYRTASSYFTDTVVSSENIFRAADSFLIPTISLTPAPTVIITPTPIDADNPCDDISVDIFGNGVGSINGADIVCVNNTVVDQSNEIIINTNVTVDTNTGNNSNGSTASGDASTDVNVIVRGGTNISD